VFERAGHQDLDVIANSEVGCGALIASTGPISQLIEAMLSQFHE